MSLIDLVNVRVGPKLPGHRTGAGGGEVHRGMVRSRLVTWLVAGVAGCAWLVPAPGPAQPPMKVGIGRADLTWHVGGGAVTKAWKVVADAAGSLAEQDIPDDPLHFFGLHSRPQAKAIVVAAPKPFAFVRADLLMITGDLYEAVAQRVTKQTGIPPERLLVAATHTHVANNGLFPHVVHGVVYRGLDPREQVFLADQIAAAVAEAAAHLRPATLAVGSGLVTIAGENRRWTDQEQLKKHPYANERARLDPELGVLRFDDAETGKPLAVMMNYGVHPVVLIDNPLVSADFIVFAERRLQDAMRDRATGHAPMAIWFTGAQGDQDAIYVRYSYPEAEWTGRVFADEAARVAKRLHPTPLVHAAITQKVIPLPPPGGQPVPSSEIFGPRLPIDGPAPVLIPSSVRLQAIELSTASQETVLMSWPGEPIRDLGVAMKRRARALGFDHAFVLALANDWAGYWLTPQEFERGRYERTLMFYGRTSGLYVEDHVIDLVHSLATGAAPSQVPLPPKALADRALTAALAQAAYAADPAVTTANAPAPEPPPAILKQPSSIERPHTVSFSWRGGSPDAASGWIPHVRVLRADGKTVAEEGTGELLLSYASPRAGTDDWTATWEALPSTPTGVYRFVVDAVRTTPAGEEPFTLTSNPFAVKACTCLGPSKLIVDRQPDGSVRLRVAATYAGITPLPVPHTAGGFRLQPLRVTSGSALIYADGVPVTLSFVSNVKPVSRTVTVRDISGKDLPVTIAEPTDVGMFEAVWRGPASRFELARVADAYGNVSSSAVTTPRPARGASVGFWASQTLQPCASSTDPAFCPRNMASYTPEVWNALASAHGSLYLNMVYASDFGPTPAGQTPRTDGLAIIREANRRGIVVNAWITTPFARGTFANENNGAVMAQAVRAFDAWVKQTRVSIAEIVLDLEFPLGYQPLADALAGDPSSLMRPNIDPVHQCEAIAQYRGAIGWAHAHGWRITGAPVPFALDDLEDGNLALQDALDVTATMQLGYDMLYLQAYRTYNDAGTGYVPSYYRDMQRYFGARGQITLGDVNMGTPPYNNLQNLVTDVRMLAGFGATTIPVYDLDGTVRSFSAEGVRAVIEAGRQPLTGAGLAAASKPDAYSDLTRAFFRGLDTLATGLSTVVTAGGGPNSYPDRCGNV